MSSTYSVKMHFFFLCSQFTSSERQGSGHRTIALVITRGILRVGCDPTATRTLNHDYSESMNKEKT